MNGIGLFPFLRYVFVTFLFCLLIGLANMFGREVTLDNVRNIDFKIIRGFSSGIDILDPKGRDIFLSSVGNLTNSDGEAFYPVALIYRDGCIENGRVKKLCGTFPSLSSVQNQLRIGNVFHTYGVDILETKDGKYLYISELDGGGKFLVGDAGKYVVHGRNSIMPEITFLKGAHYFLTTERGVSKLWEKNRWLWLMILIVSAAVYVFLLRTRKKFESHLRDAYQERKLDELRVIENNSLISQLRLKIDSLQDEMSLDTSSEEKERLKNDLEEKNRELAELWEHHEDAVQSLERQEEMVSALRKKIGDDGRSRDIYRLGEELKNLKSLWLTEYPWVSRRDVESNVVTNSQERTPFTLYIALTGFERYLKRMCRINCIDAEDNVTRINRLFLNDKISISQKEFLTQVRIARNKWFHEGKYPDLELVSRLLRFLEKENTSSGI